MKQRISWTLGLCLATLALSPQLLAEEPLTGIALALDEAVAPQLQATPTPKASEVPEAATDRVAPGAALWTNNPSLSAAVGGDSPAAVGSSSGIYATCVPCSTHADCASICGGELYYDYLCMWTYGVCGVGVHLKQCSCN